MSIETMPKEMSFQIISYLEIKDLGRCARVSTGWNSATYNDGVIREWFRCKFNETLLPLDIPARTALCKRLTQIPVNSLAELDDLVSCFMCSLNWETKRRFECEFPRTPDYALVIEHSCGPKRGTRPGFESSAAEQTEYYSYQGQRLDGTVPKRFFAESTSEILCGMPYYQYASRWATKLESHHTYIFNRLTEHPLCVKNIDIGYGNTLGYFSERNNWKRPFKLVCTNPSTWVGIMPCSTQYKFVKIDQTGKITWENDGFFIERTPGTSNRYLTKDTTSEFSTIDGSDITFPS